DPFGSRSPTPTWLPRVGWGSHFRSCSRLLMSDRPEIVDLRSDTVTRPTPGMRRAIAEADVGDMVLGDDPTVERLERRMAEELGQEAALFFPSGVMANQTAVLVLARPGTE